MNCTVPEQTRTFGAIVVLPALLLGACGSRDTAELAPFFSATLRGAFDARLEWRGEQLATAGSPRPDGSGLRLSFRGERASDHQIIQVIVGLDFAPGVAAGAAVPANLTVILEGTGRIYATRGSRSCAVDGLQQQPAATPGGQAARVLVSGRGYCVGPASTLDGDARLFVERFDFRGEIARESSGAATQV